MNKEEIIKTSVKIDTFETSILPYEDCCVIFSPKHPLTRPILEVEQQHFEEMHIEELLEKAVNETTIYDFSSKGIETFND
jgi:thiamine biosynthesis protein ThiI